MKTSVQEFFIKEFGFQDGLRMYGVVLPNITRDFEKMMNNSLVGIEIKEEYRFEDRKDSITLFGRKSQDGSCNLTGILIHGHKLEIM